MSSWIEGLSSMIRIRLFGTVSKWFIVLYSANIVVIGSVFGRPKEAPR